MAISPVTFRAVSPAQPQGKPEKKEESIEEILKKRRD